MERNDEHENLVTRCRTKPRAIIRAIESYLGVPFSRLWQKVSELEFLPHVGQTPICPGICPSIGVEVWRARVTGGVTPIPVWILTLFDRHAGIR